MKHRVRTFLLGSLLVPPGAHRAGRYFILAE